MNQDDKERLWNLLIYDVYATDKEFSDIVPALAVMVLVLGFIIFLIWLFRGT